MRPEPRRSRIPSWAVKVENYLLLLNKKELVELLRTTGQSVSTLAHRSPEQIRQSFLGLPQEIVLMALREWIRQQNRRLN
jgi:hypothetical protein